MKKTVKLFIIICVFCLTFAIDVLAEQNDYYTEQYKNSGINSLEDYLSEDAKQILNSLSISSSDPEFALKITAQSVFESIFSFLKGGLSSFKSAFISLCLICIFSAVANIFCEEKIGEQPVIYVSALCICTVVLVPLFSHISTVVSAIKSGSVFMLSFVPVYAGVLLLGSMKFTATAASGTLLLAAQGVSVIASFIILPLLSGYLAISVSSTVFADRRIGSFSKSIKKAMLWILSGTLTLFVGVLSVQTAITSATDSLSTKTAKFMLSSLVPVVGQTLGDSLTTLLGSFKLLRTSAAVYAIFAVAAIFLPIIIQTLLWQLTIKAAEKVANLFSQQKSAVILNPLSDALTLINGLNLFVFLLFVISLGVLLGMGGPA